MKCEANEDVEIELMTVWNEEITGYCQLVLCRTQHGGVVYRHAAGKECEG